MKRDKSNRAWVALQQVAWSEFLADALRSSGRRHEKLRRRCARKISQRSIHDLRVETRRQLALTALAGEVCGAPLDTIRQSLKRILHVTAKLRDAEVQLDHVDEMLPEYPELRAFRRRLRRSLDRRIGETERKLRRRKKKLPNLVHSLAAVVNVPLETLPAAPAIVRALRGAFTEAHKFSLAAHQGGKQLHGARLAVKRLRYLAEVLRDRVPGITGAWIEKLQRAQRAMGDIHDLEILTGRIAKHTARRTRERRRLRRVQTVLAGREKRLLHAFRSQLPAPPVQLRRILAR